MRRGLLPEQRQRGVLGNRGLWTPGGPSPVLESVVWGDLYRCTAVGSQLTSDPVLPNGTANSTKMIQSGDGYVSFTCPGAYLNDLGFWFGVKPANGAYLFDYRLRVRSAPNNWFYVYNEAGGLLYNGTHAQGAGYKIAIEGGIVKFYYNLTSLAYTSLIVPSYPLGVHAFFGYTNCVTDNVQLYGVLA